MENILLFFAMKDIQCDFATEIKRMPIIFNKAKWTEYQTARKRKLISAGFIGSNRTIQNDFAVVFFSTHWATFETCSSAPENRITSRLLQINTVNKCWWLEMNLQDMQITNRWKITSICLACRLDTMHLQQHLICWWNVSISKPTIHCRRTSNARSWMISIHLITMKRFAIRFTLSRKFFVF